MFKLFDTKELQEFATSLANDLGRRFPPSSEARTDPGAKRQLAVILEGLAVRAQRYHEQHKLGVYRKAKLANSFRWRLDELGFSGPFVDAATKEIVKRLAAKK